MDSETHAYTRPNIASVSSAVGMGMHGTVVQPTCYMVSDASHGQQAADTRVVHCSPPCCECDASWVRCRASARPAPMTTLKTMAAAWMCRALCSAILIMRTSRHQLRARGQLQRCVQCMGSWCRLSKRVLHGLVIELVLKPLPCTWCNCPHGAGTSDTPSPLATGCSSTCRG